MKINQISNQLALLTKCIVSRADGDEAAIGEHDFQFIDVVGGSSIDGRVGSTGVVGNHAAERGAGTGGDVRSETKTMRPQELIELIENDSRADPNGSAFQVEIGDLA